MSKKEEESKSIEEVIKEIKKKYGEGSVISGETKQVYDDVISTGSLGLDLAIGVGGIPKRGGKIIEVKGWESSGKSTLCQSIIANFQKAGEKVLLIDGEHSLDQNYAKEIGINLKDLTVIQLDEEAGEGAYDKMEMLVKTGQFGLVVIDSYNALLPKKLLEGEMGEATMGLHARMMSKIVPKTNTLGINYGTNFIFVGQLREKIGVMFGCLHGETLVNFTDGRSIPIKKVVEEKIKGKVWSWNEKENIFEEKEIIDWHYNGNVSKKEDYIHFITEGINSKNGRFGFTVTQDHKILTKSFGKFWKEAKKVELGDEIVSKYEKRFNGEKEDFLKGVLVGDSHLSLRKNNTACIKIQDSKNLEYAKWKVNLLGLNFKQSNNKFTSDYSYELALYKKSIYNRDPVYIFNNDNRKIEDISLAVWIMDDGCYNKKHNRYSISIKRFKNDVFKMKKIQEIFFNTGLNPTFNIKNGNFVFKVKDTNVIANKINKYVPNCMKYKLPDGFECYGDNLFFEEKTLIKETTVKVLEKKVASERQMRAKGKYDISIKDNHNYVVGGVKNGVVVHNSPETTQGGNALKFYAHLRMNVSRSTTKENSVMDGDEKLGNKTTVKIDKNKLGAPFKSCNFNIIYGKGIDKISEIIDIAHDFEILKVYGKSITYQEVKYEGETFKQMVRDNDELYEELKSKICEEYDKKD